MMLFIKKQREDKTVKTDLTKDVNIKDTSVFDVDGKRIYMCVCMCIDIHV
jgi:hypothetical protein